MVKVYAPASIGNVSVGFDVLGAAVSPMDGSLLGDYVTVEAADTFSLKTDRAFCQQAARRAMEDNIVYQCWERFCQEIGKEDPGGDDAGKKHADWFRAGFQRLFGGRRSDGDE